MGKSLKKRFDEKHQIDPETGCWVWTAGRNRDGYGKIWHGESVGAHRVSWILHRGEITDGLFVLHKCDNPVCVNPDHLFLGTQQENIADMNDKGRHAEALGSDHHKAKICEGDVYFMRGLVGKMSNPEIGEIFGVSRHIAYAVCAGKSWKTVPSMGGKVG